MASRIEKNLAGRVFNLQKQAGRVPPTVLASARRILQNASGQGDVDSVRRYLGISKSGAGALGKVGKKLARIQGAAFSISQDIELLQHAAQDGRPTAVATARLIGNLNDQVQQAIKSRWAQRTAEAAAKLLGRDPVIAGRLLKAVGRGLRLGGLVVTAAMGAAEVAERFFENRRQAGAAIGARKDLARQLQMDPRLARAEEALAAEEVRGARGKARTFLDRLGFNAGTEQETTKRQADRLRQLEQARRNASHLGVDVEGVLAGVAAQKGKLISELTQRERNEAIDEALRPKIQTLESMKNSEMVNKQLEREFGKVGSYGHLSLFAKDVSSTLTFGLTQTSEQAVAERRDQLAREMLGKVLAVMEKRQEEIDQLAQQMKAQRTPAQQQMHRDRLDRAEGEFNSHRSRHRAWSTN
jgi:hypothetical protein